MDRYNLESFAEVICLALCDHPKLVAEISTKLKKLLSGKGDTNHLLCLPENHKEQIQIFIKELDLTIDDIENSPLSWETIAQGDWS